jgi:hypothetical protein
VAATCVCLALRNCIAGEPRKQPARKLSSILRPGLLLKLARDAYQNTCFAFIHIGIGITIETELETALLISTQGSVPSTYWERRLSSRLRLMRA